MPALAAGFSRNVSSVCFYDGRSARRVFGSAPCLALPAANATGSSTPCRWQSATCPAARVAVCMVGALRSFPSPAVHTSIAASLLHALRCSGSIVDLFAVVSLRDSGTLTRAPASPSQWNSSEWMPREHRIHAAAEEARDALAHLRPRAVALWAEGADHAAPNPQCDGRLAQRGFLAVQGASAGLGQAAAWSQCLRMIEMAEAESGGGGGSGVPHSYVYTHVVKTRPDLQWEVKPHPKPITWTTSSGGHASFSGVYRTSPRAGAGRGGVDTLHWEPPHPTICALDRERGPNWQLVAAGPEMLARGHVDHHFVATRWAARAVLGLYDSYRECDVANCGGGGGRRGPAGGGGGGGGSCPATLEEWTTQACLALGIAHACRRFDFRYRLVRGEGV